MIITNFVMKIPQAESVPVYAKIKWVNACLYALGYQLQQFNYKFTIEIYSCFSSAEWLSNHTIPVVVQVMTVFTRYYLRSLRPRAHQGNWQPQRKSDFRKLLSA
jgi:hypothetical protein